mmetsp:Transcript_12020/g.16989  ORF Transcript_12020/g.16989 Transcript_12020/m.16989 type:complete len:123 (+) Transcript_12020:188-556(+)
MICIRYSYENPCIPSMAESPVSLHQKTLSNDGSMPEPHDLKSEPRLRAEYTIQYPSETFSVKFSEDQRTLVAGCGDGSLKVYETSTGKIKCELLKGNPNALPITSIRFRPDLGQPSNHILKA